MTRWWCSSASIGAAVELDDAVQAAHARAAAQPDPRPRPVYDAIAAGDATAATAAMQVLVDLALSDTRNAMPAETPV